jgi:3-oxoacyl-[acyl-carrier protein] reductase
MQKTVIVTGASRGIGKAIALQMADEGYNVIVNYVNRQDEAMAVVKLIEIKNKKAVAVQADVAVLSDVEKLFSVAIQAFGEIDAVVNNAGVSTVSPLVETVVIGHTSV